ncbi:MAG: hypothetical protein M3Q42_04915 [Pseudomonadota bacterium]|nr:hypothetical protein [Pseudomonadota bacterium]
MPIESPHGSDSVEHGLSRARAELPERAESLWRLTAGPAVWATHFLLCYVTAAVWCAKAGSRAAPLGDARLLLAAYTVAALALIAYFGWRGFRQHRHGKATLPHDEDSAEDRHRFLGFATMLLCGLSFVAVLYVAFAIVLIGTCR